MFVFESLLITKRNHVDYALARLKLLFKKQSNLIEIKLEAEKYSELKASYSFFQLQLALAEIEDQIAAAWSFYTTAAKDYNRAIEIFPTNMVAMQRGYEPIKLIDFSEQDKQNVNQLFQ